MSANLGNLITTMSVDVSQMRQNLQDAERMAQQNAQRIQREMNAATDALRNGLNSLTSQTAGLNRNVDALAKKFGSLGGVIGAAFQFTLTSYAMQGWDYILRLPAQLATATDKLELQMMRIQSLTQTSFGFGDVLTASKRLGVSMEAYTGLFQRFAVAKEATSLTTAELVKMTDTLINLGRLGGIPIQELTTRSIQLAQGVASGKLQGDELRAVLEGMPIVIREIARELNIPMDQIRKMAADGKITGRDIADALLKIGPRMASEFAKIPETLEMINERLTTESGLLLAHLDHVTGLGDTWKDILRSVERYMELYRLRGMQGFAEQAAMDMGRPQTSKGDWSFWPKAARLENLFNPDWWQKELKVWGDMQDLSKINPLFGKPYRPALPSRKEMDEPVWRLGSQPTPDQRQRDPNSPNWRVDPRTGKRFYYVDPLQYIPALTQEESVKRLQPELVGAVGQLKGVEDVVKTALLRPETRQNISALFETVGQVATDMQNALRGKAYMDPADFLQVYDSYLALPNKFEQVAAQLQSRADATPNEQRAATMLKDYAKTLNGMLSPDQIKEFYQMSAQATDRVTAELNELRTGSVNKVEKQKRDIGLVEKDIRQSITEFGHKLLGIVDPEYSTNLMRMVKERDRVLADIETQKKVLEQTIPGADTSAYTRLSEETKKNRDDITVQYMQQLNSAYSNFVREYGKELERIKSGEREITTVREQNVMLQEALNAASKDGYVNEALKERLKLLVEQTHEAMQQQVAWRELYNEVKKLYDFQLQIRREEADRTAAARAERDEAVAALMDEKALRAALAGDMTLANVYWQEAEAIREQTRALQEQQRIKDVKMRGTTSFGEPVGPFGPQSKSGVIEAIKQKLGANTGGLLEKLAKQYNMDPAFVMGLIQRESNFNPRAFNPKDKDAGLFQFIPSTAKMMGLRDPFNPEENMDAGMRYLAYNANALRKAGVPVTYEHLAAAHNAGVGAVINARGVPNNPGVQKHTAAVMGYARQWGLEGVDPTIMAETEGNRMSALANSAVTRAGWDAQKGGQERSKLRVSKEGYEREGELERFLRELDDERRNMKIQATTEMAMGKAELEMERQVVLYERMWGTDKADMYKEQLKAQRALVDELRIQQEVEEWITDYKQKYMEIMKAEPTDIEAQRKEQEALIRAQVEGERQLADMRESQQEELNGRLKAYQQLGMDVANAMQDSFSSLFFDLMQGKLDDFVGQFKTAIDRIVANFIAAQLAEQVFGAGWQGSNNLLGGLLGQGLGWLGAATGLFNGPPIPTADVTAIANSALNAPPMASGGYIRGMRTDAVPIIAHGGEFVLTPEQLNTLMGAGGGGGDGRTRVVINVNAPTDVAQFRRSKGQLALEMSRALQGATARNV